MDKSHAHDLHKIPRYFVLPVMAMVLITILNDGIIMLEVGKVPEKWNLPVVFVACGGSTVMCLSELDSVFAKYVKNLTFRQIQCALHLKVSTSDSLTVFVARTHGFFFTRHPGVLSECFRNVHVHG